MSQMLMKVQVGPVQEFIAQARSTRDMWAGSYLLSWLTASAMKVFKEADRVEFIFPTLEDQPLYEMFEGNPSDEGLIPTLPNVFMLLVEEERAEALAAGAKDALKGELKTIGDACWKEMIQLGASDGWKLRWDQQLEAFPIFNWHAVSVSNDWKNDVERLGEEMAARRNTREFRQWEAGDVGVVKDVLSGKDEVIGNEEFWKKDAWKKAGPYGAMNCIKRLFPDAFLEKRFKGRKAFWERMSVTNTRDLAARNREGESGHTDQNGETCPKNPYIAVLAMDGDSMGVALRGLEEKTEHTEFSETLATFAVHKVAPLVKKVGGQLIYAGGDDVLAMCAADRALDLAEQLADSFRETMKEYGLDSSCGIAVGRYTFPLQRLVEEARQAESRAKNKRGRAAFAISLLKRSGEMIHWGAKWDSKALEVYENFTQKTKDDVFSGRLPYALAELFQPYRLDEKTDIDLKPILEKEFLHVLNRQSAGKVKEWPEAVEYLKKLDWLQDFPNLFLASAFIMNRQRGEN